MIENKTILAIKKQLLTESFFKERRNKKLFRYLDEQVVKKCFANLCEQSTNENILNIETINLTKNEIIDIIDKFIQQRSFKYLVKKRYIFEIVKISNLPMQKISKIISKNKYMQLGKKLVLASEEIKYISFDFLILRILNNFILKMEDTAVIDYYSTLKKNILKRFMFYQYQHETKEKTSTYLCWVDLLLNATLEKNISAQDFICINKKIIDLTRCNIDLLWKISSSTSYLLQQDSFCDEHDLRNFRREILKKINTDYQFHNFKKNNVIDIMTSVLSKKTTCKEDFYQLFDAIKLFSQNSVSDKLFCFNLFWYIINQNKKTNIFSFRFIREYFLNTLFNIINNDDSVDVKIEEYLFLSMLLCNQDDFNIHQADIFERLMILLKDFNNSETTITSQLFYKFCDILDYLLTKIQNINHIDISAFLASNKRTELMIKKHLVLSI